ncbi:MAG: DinB family protein [Chitinophagaceae bacterium]
MSKIEYWLNGPIENIPPLLQPVAHALLQSRDEIKEALNGFSENLIWQKPGGSASVAFHVQHIPGVIDRLFTYAKGEELSQHQLEYLSMEGKEQENIKMETLISQLDVQVDKAIEQLRYISENSLLEHRGVGRKKIPSNVIGLLFHAAEHVQRHSGQLLVTAKVLSR